MSDMPIEFSCNCGQRIAVGDEMAGRPGRCPGCGQVLTVPDPRELARPPVPAAPALEPDAELRACPYCAEKIRADAKKCRYCGEYLDPAARARAAAAPAARVFTSSAAAVTEEAARLANHSLGYGLLAWLCLPIFAPLAVMKGNECRRFCGTNRLPLPGAATAGLVMGWVMVVLMVGFVLLLVVILAAAGGRIP